MKRSEMIKIMDDALAVYYRQFVGNPDGLTSTDYILSVMEEMGLSYLQSWSNEAYNNSSWRQ